MGLKSRIFNWLARDYIKQQEKSQAVLNKIMLDSIESLKIDMKRANSNAARAVNLRDKHETLIDTKPGYQGSGYDVPSF